MTHATGPPMVPRTSLVIMPPLWIMPAAAVKELQAVGKLKFDILTVDPDKQDQFLKDNPEIANDIEGQIRANADKLYATRRPAGRAVAAAEKPADPAAAKEPVVKAPTRSSESELDIMVED